MLAALPVQNARAGVLTDGTTTDPPFLSQPFDEFYETLRTQPVHLDLHTSVSPQGFPLGALQIQFDNDWFHPFCS